MDIKVKDYVGFWSLVLVHKWKERAIRVIDFRPFYSVHGVSDIDFGS